MDMKTGLPIGSVIPQENGDCIIRYGHHPSSEPMQEDVVDFVVNKRTTMFKAAGIVCGRLLITGDDAAALACFDPEVYQMTDSYIQGCMEEGAEDA